MAAKRCVVKAGCEKGKEQAGKVAGNCRVCGQAEQTPHRTGGNAGDMSMQEALHFAKGYGCEAFSLTSWLKGWERQRRLIAGIRPGQSIAVFIGPEGGFEDGEVGGCFGVRFRAGDTGAAHSADRNGRLYRACLDYVSAGGGSGRLGVPIVESRHIIS